MRDWWAVGRAASVERPFDAWPSWEAIRKKFATQRHDGHAVRLAALLDGRVAGASSLWCFDLDNTHLAQIEIWVHPDARRRGVGSALLADAEARVRREGRTTMVATAFAPVGAESPGSLFAGARGYAVASHEQTKLVDLRRAPAGWAALDEQVAAALGHYRVVVAEEAVPEQYVGDFCGLLSAFLGEVPTGDLDLTPVSWSRRRVRDTEERFRREGIVNVYGLAVAPDGHLCGFSDLRVSREDPRHATVGGTLVLPGHRGHRLGLAMKLGTHRRVVELFPGCERAETGNAGVNAAMNAVNEQLGYRVVERALDLQKRL
nr:GNAT family N-acetyltransferase [Nocardioides panaciterrulae]